MTFGYSGNFYFRVINRNLNRNRILHRINALYGYFFRLRLRLLTEFWNSVINRKNTVTVIVTEKFGYGYFSFFGYGYFFG